MNEEDVAIIRSAQRNPKTFESVYRKYRQRVYRYFLHHIGFDEQQAEDFTQDAFVRAFAHLRSFTIRGYSYLTYLLTISHNLLVSHFRKRPTVPLEEAAQLADDPRDRLQQRIDADHIWREVTKLPLSEREAILLRYQQELATKDIARIMHRSVNAVKLLLSRGRRKLRDIELIAAATGANVHRLALPQQRFLRIKR